MIFYFLYHFFIRSWWVIGFLILCLIFYEHTLAKREKLFQQMYVRKYTLEKEKLLALQQQKNLQRQINSQSDPAWIELTLMKGLGVVPEGQKKVYFSSD